MQTFTTEILSYEKISKIDHSWNIDDYKSLLELMDLADGFDSMDESEIREMCLISLTDFEPEDAAKFVLKHLIKNKLTDGKLTQMSNDMLDERLWEQFADLSFHRKLFDAYSLLREAFNGKFAKPTAVRFKIKITSNSSNFKVFDDSLHPAIVRLLVSGMDKDSIINRIYSEEMDSNNFSEAENIIWEIKELSSTKKEREYEIISSFFWFEDLEEVEKFEGKTKADEEEKEED